MTQPHWGGGNLAGGRSTFMVEMTEAANILHNATGLVLLDEIGRGASLLTVWLIGRGAQHLAETPVPTLFATSLL